MTEDFLDDSGSEDQTPSEPHPQSQEIRHNQISALVPEHVARGTFSTGAVVLHGSHEFIIDFLLRMQQPQQVAARIVLPPTVVAQFIQALKENLKKYTDRFGEPAKPGAAAQAAGAGQGAGAGGQGQGQESGGQPQTTQIGQPNAQELYDQLKLPDDVMSGDYANAVMIGHTATEFSFDFITTFFPRSAVSHRVYLSAPNVPRLLDSLNHSFGQYQQRRKGQPPQSPAS